MINIIQTLDSFIKNNDRRITKHLNDCSYGIFTFGGVKLSDSNSQVLFYSRQETAIYDCYSLYI